MTNTNHTTKASDSINQQKYNWNSYVALSVVALSKSVLSSLKLKAKLGSHSNISSPAAILFPEIKFI